MNAAALNEEAGNAPADAVVAHDIPHEDRPAKLRKLKRWGSAEHASRVIKAKLSGCNQLEIQSAVGKKTGMSVKDYIQQHDRKNKKDAKNNLASSFWVGFFGEFDLSSFRVCNLASSDDSGGSEMINDELLTALAQAHDPNPAQRRVDNFTN